MKQFAIIDPAEGVLFRAPSFDDALRIEEGAQVIGVLTLAQVSSVVKVVGRLNRELVAKDQYHVGFLPDHRIAPVSESGLVSRELYPIAAVVGIVSAKASLADFRESYLALPRGDNPVKIDKLLAA